MTAQKAIAEKWGSLTYSVKGFEVYITDCDQGAKGELIMPREIDGLPVTKIGKNAFESCELLTSVQIPDTVTEIEYGAFFNCKSMLSDLIPETVKSIGNNVYYGCSLLTVAEWPNSLPIIPGYTFKDCKGLKQFNVPNGVTTIGPVAFGNSGIEQITLPGTLKTIGKWAFDACKSLKSISIPLSVDSIADGAFIGSDYLTQVRIPERFHSETEANRMGLISAWPNGFLLPDTDISGPEDSLEIRMAPVVTVKGIPGTVKTIDFADSASGPWKLWRIVVVASGGTSEVDLDVGASNRFYRIR
jgi:hypothetical protein